MKNNTAIQFILYPLNDSKGAWKLKPPIIYLFSQTTGVSRELLEQVKIYSRTPLRYIPWYPAFKGGGAITLGNTNWKSITFTENYFSSDQTYFKGKARANNLNAWLSLLSHEVGHLKHAKRFKSIIVYLIIFLIQYLRYGHDKAPLEIEADRGQANFLKFNKHISQQLGSTALESLLAANMTDAEKISTINKWLADYKSK